MAAILPNTTGASSYVQVENFGSTSMRILQFTGSSTSDTYTIEAGAPVISFWAQPNMGTTTTSAVDVSFVQSTGVFTISTVTNTVNYTLFILMRT